MLREAARAGLTRRLAEHGFAPGLDEAAYRERLVSQAVTFFEQQHALTDEFILA